MTSGHRYAVKECLKVQCAVQPACKEVLPDPKCPSLGLVPETLVMMWTSTVDYHPSIAWLYCTLLPWVWSPCYGVHRGDASIVYPYYGHTVLWTRPPSTGHGWAYRSPIEQLALGRVGSRYCCTVQKYATKGTVPAVLEHAESVQVK